MWNRLAVLGLSVAAVAVAGAINGTRLKDRLGIAPSLSKPLPTSDDSVSSDMTPIFATQSAWPPSPVEDLNDRIQDRFQNLKNFGGTRLMPLSQHLREYQPHLKPKTSEEEEVIKFLEYQHWTVNLYLGGRDLLEAPMSKDEWKKAGLAETYRTIGSPFLISGKSDPTNLPPEPLDLWKFGQKAIAESATSDQFETKMGQWTIEARPVRANRVECLRCHSSSAAGPSFVRQKTHLKLGDALGVVIYAYARGSD